MCRDFSNELQLPRWVIFSDFGNIICNGIGSLLPADFKQPDISVQWNLNLRTPDLRKNLDLRNIVATTNFLVHKLFDLRKIF